MTQPILILIVCSMAITSTVNFMKPWYKGKVGKRYATVTIALSFILWIVASFSVAPYLWIELNTGLLVLIGLALWTWSNLFYDIWEIVKSAGDKIRSTREGE